MSFDPKAYLATKNAEAAEPEAPKAEFDPVKYLMDKGTNDDAILEALDAPSVIQEMHPQFTDADRLVVKNFTNNNEAAVNYLQKRHPDLEVSIEKMGGSDQIKARKRDGSEKDYRVLDPDTGFFSTDMLRDAGDVAYDVLAGVGTNAATLAGGVAGSAVPGAGTLAGAAAGGAAASGGLEYLRQKLGNMFGVEQETDGTNIAAATAAGAVSPLLFGATGAGGKAVQGGLGLIKDKALKPLATNFGGFLTGKSPDALATLGKKSKEFYKIADDELGTLNFLDETGAAIDKAVDTAKSAKFQEFNEGLGDIAAAPIVDTSRVKEALKAAIKREEAAAKAGGNTEPSREILERLKDAFRTHFVGEEVVPVAKMVEKSTGVLDAAGKPVMTAVEEIVEQPVKKEIGNLNPQAAINLSRRLSQMAHYEKINPTQMVGGHMSPGASFSDKRLAAIGSELKDILDKDIDKVLPEHVMPARRELGELINMETEIKTLTKSPRTMFANLRNSDITSNRTVQQQLRKIDKKLGTDLGERAKMAMAIEQLAPGRASWWSGGLQRTPAALLGGYLGAKAGGGTGGENNGLEGFALGSALGFGLSTPWAIRQLIKSGKGIGGAANKLQKLGGPVLSPAQIIERQAIQSPWMGVE